MNLLLALFGLLTAPLASGPAYHYTAGTFAEVARVRHMALSPHVDGYAASPNCAYVDPLHPYVVLARLYNPVARRWGAVQMLEVIDCTRPADLRRHYRVLEVDWLTAHRAGWAWPPGDGHSMALVYGYRRLNGGMK